MKSLSDFYQEPIWEGPSAECWESVSITNNKTAGSEVSHYWGEAFEGDEETVETKNTVRNKRNLVGSDSKRINDYLKYIRKKLNF